MQIKSQEHYDMISQFEREFSGRTDKEDKKLWPMGQIYQDGMMNELFKAYRKGYAYRQGIANLEK